MIDVPPQTGHPRRVAVIINGRAGRGDAIARQHEADRLLWGWPLEFFIPKSVEETRRVIESLSPATHEAVVLVGGDGTVSTALDALRERGVPLVAFPGGTANDLSRELGITEDWQVVQEVIDTRSSTRIDLVSANGRSFATVGGTGIGAALTAEINAGRGSTGLVSRLMARVRAHTYSLMAIKAIAFSSYIHRMRVEWEGPDGNGTWEGWVSSLLVCNQCALGGDLRAAPEARNRDGMFDVALISDRSRARLIKRVLEAKIGKPLPADRRIRAARLTIEDVDGRAIRVFGDGETLTHEPRCVFELIPDGLAVYRRRQHARDGQ